MVNAQRTQQWTAILNITQQMLKAARDEAWEELVDMEENRRNLISDFFSESAAPDEVCDITEGTQEILAIDKEIMAISRKQRDLIGSALSDIKKHRQVKKAYLENTGS